MNLQLFARILVYISVVIVFISAIIALVYDKKYIKKPIIIVVVFTGLFFLIRAYLKEFFPFTDKLESFITLFWLICISAVYYINKFSNKEFSVLLFLAFLAGLGVFIFKDIIKYPPPYLRTIWYPLHVPASFLAYTFWFMAAIKSMFKSSTHHSNSAFISNLNRNAYMLFTFGMISGGIWGYLAWGAYFLWDPKLVWSLILWFYYGNLLHIDYIPSLKKYKRNFYIAGIFLILITFIGTGFFSRSIHRF
ncbi:MAG: cytochrome c biogenesis protein CcsA [Spirochaetia bacterium]|nr:cytochrome c biogenesis protein CcsA [Spirochaetia bacterium]